MDFGAEAIRKIPGHTLAPNIPLFAITVNAVVTAHFYCDTVVGCLGKVTPEQHIDPWKGWSVNETIATHRNDRIRIAECIFLEPPASILGEGEIWIQNLSGLRRRNLGGVRCIKDRRADIASITERYV
jgi:hypothetical protein